MNVDLDEAIDTVMPWDLSFTIKRKQFIVPPLSVANVCSISKFSLANDEEKVQIVSRLFAEPKPDLRSLTILQFTKMIQRTTSYMQEHLSKNLPAASKPESSTAASQPTSTGA